VIRSSGLWGGLFWLAIGAFVVWAGRDMGLGELSDPGPGFAFYWVGLLMCVLALRSSVRWSSVVGRIASLWAGTVAQVLAVVAVLLVWRGILDARVRSSHAGVAALPDVVHRSGDWRLAVVIALVATFGVWAALSHWLKIQLPATSSRAS
jgi:hypothetical protein